MSTSQLVEKAPSIAEMIVDVPEGVRVEVKDRVVTVTGPKGTLTRDLSHMPIQMELVQGGVRTWKEWPRKKELAMVGTAAATVRNMIIGVTKGYAYKLRIVYAHFPITVKVQKDRLLIENFTGEKTPRSAAILPGVQVKVQGDMVTVEGMDKELVGQTAANIQNATRIKEKDQRVFLDGIYVESGGPASS